MKTRFLGAVLLAAVLAGSCVFSPKSEDSEPSENGKWQTPTSPDKVLGNLKLAFDDLNIEFYRDCLNSNYFYLSRSETDNVDIRWSKSEDVSTVENLMSGSFKVVFTAVQNSVHEEYGKDYSDIPDGAIVVPDHPTELWMVIDYLVDMEIDTKTKGDFTVHQYMEFKYLKDPKTKLYSIILWNDLTNQ
jgi:hypothetical protein